MKKSDFILIGIVVLILVLSLFTTKGNEILEEVNYPLALTGESGMHEITYNEYVDKVSDGETFIVVIERDGCNYCTMYMPVVEEVANEKEIPLYYIDIANMTKAEISELERNNKYLKRNSNWGTPTTLLMMGNRVLDALGGYTNKDGLLSFLDGKIVMGE